LPNETLVYEDENQVVISMDDYLRYKLDIFYWFEDEDDFDEEYDCDE